MSRHLVEHIQSQLTMAHQWLEGTMADVTPEMAAWQPPGKAMPIGAHYVHVVGVEDILIRQAIKGDQTLMATDYSGKTGFDSPPPWGPWEEWSRTVTVDLPLVKAYAQAVYAASIEYLSSLNDEDLDRQVTMSEGGDPMPVTMALDIAVANVLVHCGEISCLKGLQGQQGYPF